MNDNPEDRMTEEAGKQLNADAVRHAALRDGGVVSGSERANQHLCADGQPGHPMVNLGRSETHYADVYECPCRLFRRIGNTDERRARHAAVPS